MVWERDLQSEDERALRVYKSGGADAGGAFTVACRRGSAQTSAPLGPLPWAAARRGIRPLSFRDPHALVCAEH